MKSAYFCPRKWKWQRLILIMIMMNLALFALVLIEQLPWGSLQDGLARSKLLGIHGVPSCASKFSLCSKSYGTQCRRREAHGTLGAPCTWRDDGSRGIFYTWHRKCTRSGALGRRSMKGALLGTCSTLWASWPSPHLRSRHRGQAGKEHTVFNNLILSVGLSQMPDSDYTPLT